MSVRTNSRRVELGTTGWIVRNDNGCQITKPFRSRHQAESFADQTGSFLVVKVPVIWIGSMAPLKMIPLYGTAPSQEWHKAHGDDSLEVALAEKANPAKALYV